MSRNIMFSAAVVLVVLSLFLPWFTLTFSTERTTKNDFYEDGKTTTTETDTSMKYYLDKDSWSQRNDETKSGETVSTHFGDYDHSREDLEAGKEIGNTESFLYSIFKIVMVILVLSFTVLVLESFGNESDLDSMKTGIALLHAIILLLFITGIQTSYLEDDPDSGVMLSSPNSNEYVNMTMPVGFSSLVSNDTHTQYYELEDFGFEKTVVDAAPYDWTSTGNYFVVVSGPVSDDVEWDRNNYNATSTYENQTIYYVWFDREAMDANVSERDPTPDDVDDCTSSWGDQVKACKGIRVAIADLSEGNNSATASAIRDRIIQTFGASSVPFVATGNSTDSDRLYIQSDYYGNNLGGSAWSYSGYVSTEVNGFATFEAVTSDTDQTANWYPSTGFVCSLIGFVCFVGSRFED